MNSNDKPTMIPFSQLARTDHNARRTNKATNIPALAASIAAQGVLQNLVVSLAGDGTYAVHAGDRRYQAIALLIEQGKRTGDFMVPCKVIDVGNATAASLAENTMREAMHPADEFDAFVKLTEEQFTIDHIADAFGVTPLVVERRLKLTKAAPDLLEHFRAGEITTDQLIALCSTEDHDKQLRVWRSAYSYNNDPRSLRRAVLAGEIDVSTDKRIPFIGGLQVYRDAGGEVRQDLFSGDGSGGFITDPVLLDELVSTKINAEAEQFRAEGWGWVEVQSVADDTAIRRMGRIEADPDLLPADAKARIEALDAEAERLETENRALTDSDADELTEEESETYDANEERCIDIRNEIEAIEEAASVFTPELMANAGVILAYANGEVTIIKGLVRTADRAKVAEAAGDGNTVSGGRVTEPAGRKSDALSDALRRSLLAERELAAQRATASRPDVAKVLMACWAVREIRCVGGNEQRYNIGHVPANIGTISFGTASAMTNDAGKAACDAFAKLAKAAIAELPKSMPALWDVLATLPVAELDALIAYSVGLSLNLEPKHTGATGKLLEALNFDMTEHFTPTAENYLGKVSKPLIVEALKEAGKLTGKADIDALLAMKKGALATEAEKRLAGSGWVPSLIRTPKPKTPAAPKAAKPAAKAKPATDAKQKPAATKAAQTQPAKKKAA